MHDQHKFSAQAFASMAFEQGADGASVLSSCSSYSSMPALVDVHTGEEHVEPEYIGNACSCGVWDDNTRGDGDTTRGDGDTTRGDGEETGGPPRRGHDGHFGVVTANWGGHWGDDYLENHMNEDLKKTVCQVIVIQEAQPKCLQLMNEPIRGGSGMGKGGWPVDDPVFFGIHGNEPKDTSLFIGTRFSLVKGIREMMFERKLDGIYKDKGKVKKAVSKIMVGRLKMKYLRIHGGGGEETDELTIANVHLHSRTAKKAAKGPGGPAKALKDFYDRLAQYVIRFRARLMLGDFNMQLFAVIPEMRARGFEISVAGWYPFQLHHETMVRADSCGIFAIGPYRGVKIAFDQAVFGMSAAERSADNSMVMEILKNDSGREFSQKRFDVAKISEKGQGYDLSCHMPNCDAMKAKFVDMTFEVQVPSEYQHSAVVEVRDEMRKIAKQTGQPCVDFTTGESTWDWSSMPISKQKLVRSELFDPYKEFSKRGAHMPLMVFIGDKGKNRRKPESRARRDQRADERGWPAEKRTPWYFDGTKGKGAKTRGGGGKQQYTNWKQIAGPSDPKDWGWSASSSNWNSW
jgi:hypothetical protein